MYGLLSTAAMSSMRPPILAGPMPRKTKRLNIGSFDQLIGVGVGLGIGVAVALRSGEGLGDAAGVCDATTFSACAANAPSVVVTSNSAQIATSRPRRSRAE